MNNLKQLKHLLLGLTLTLAACGGGGGSTPPAVVYSGVTTQAAVTATNAKALSIDAYEGGQIGSSMGVVGVASESSGVALDAPRLKQFGTTLSASVRQILAAPSRSGTPAVAGATAQDTIYGYNGSMHYAVSYDEVSGAFSGTITFSSYRGSAYGASMSGSVGFSGVINQTTGMFSTLTMTVSSLVVDEGGRTVTAYGSIALSGVGGPTESITMSLVLSDGVTGRTYWVKNFTFTVTGSSETLTGTYYDPIHGYVTISTVIPLTVSTTGDWPTAGQLLFTGASGSKARLTFTGTGTYTVEVDATGTGTFVAVP